MRVFFLILSCLYVNISIYSQSYNVNLDASLMKEYENIKMGRKVNITNVVHDVKFNGDKIEELYSVEIESQKIPIFAFDQFNIKYDNVQSLWDALIIGKVLFPLQEKGMQSDLRKELEAETYEYITRLRNYGLVLEDSYLENYIYSLIVKIAPSRLIDGRLNDINVLILNDPTLNACIYSNGTLVIHTGLLSALHSEDELVAVLSHEIAHFVLDHHIQNINKEISRKKRAEFWGALATGLTAVVEGVAASKNGNYVPGGATIGVAILSSVVASQIVERMGQNYNIAQEEDADNVAKEILNFLGYDKNALATALNRIKDNMIVERNKQMYFQSYTHPSLVERIQKAGFPQDVSEAVYEKEISIAISSVARLKYEFGRFKQSISLIDTNIKNGVATVDDFVMKANCLLALYNDEISNGEVLELIEKAKNIDNLNLNTYKLEIKAHIRLKNYTHALNLLNEYIDKLHQKDFFYIKNGNRIIGNTDYQFIIKEKDEAKRMIMKLEKIK